VTPKEAQKALDCADRLVWDRVTNKSAQAYQWLVRLCVKYGAK
jgi:hypothetical protein